MENPWSSLPRRAPFILHSDADYVRAFNRDTDEIHKIHDELLPEPYLGRADAPIILLNLNPGYGEADAELQGKPEFRELARKNLAHEPLAFPFYFLDRDLLARHSDLCALDGPGWWQKKLKALIQQFGDEVVANGVCCIEFFPYHSRRFKVLEQTLPSQDYSFHLVRQAIERHAVIVMMRGERYWVKAMPELARYPVFRLINHQNVTISPGNCRDFPQIVERLRRGS